MDCITNSKDVSLHSTPGFPILHCLPELVQTHVHRVGEAIQPSHLLLFTSPQSFPASGSVPMSQLLEDSSI